MADVPEIKKVWYWGSMRKHWLDFVLHERKLMLGVCFAACYDRVWKYGYVVSHATNVHLT